MIEAFDKMVADYESDIDELTEELSAMTHGAEFAYEKMVTMADSLDALADDLEQAGVNPQVVEDVMKLFVQADVAAGEISLLIHPVRELA